MGSRHGLAIDLRLVEEVTVEVVGCVEDLETDDLAVFPVRNDEGLLAFGWIELDTLAARCERLLGEVDVGGVGAAVVGDPHAVIFGLRINCHPWVSRSRSTSISAKPARHDASATAS